MTFGRIEEELRLPATGLGVERPAGEAESFRACQEVLTAFYRYGESSRVAELFGFCTEDVVFELVGGWEPHHGVRLEGKPALREWMLSGAEDLGSTRIIHACANFIWRASAGVVQANYYNIFYAFTLGQSDPPAPAGISDCIARFRLEDGRWLLSYRHYTYLYAKPGLFPFLEGKPDE